MEIENMPLIAVLVCRTADDVTGEGDWASGSRARDLPLFSKHVQALCRTDYKQT